MSRPQRRVFPVPDFLAKDWTIQPTASEDNWWMTPPGSNVQQKIMQVPLTATGPGFGRRLHELGHVKWSPPKEGVDLVTRLVEMRRINQLLEHRAEMNMAEVELLESPAREYLADFIGSQVALSAARITEKPQLLEVAGIITALLGTTEQRKVLDGLPRFSHEVIEQVREVMDKHLTGADLTYADTQAAVKALRELFDHSRDQQVAAEQALSEEPQESDRDSHTGMAQSFRSEDSDWATDEWLKAVETEARFFKTLDGDAEYDLDDRTKWGEMLVRTGDLALAYPPRLKLPRPRALDEGVVLRHPHRYIMDGRIFAARMKKPGSGTILVDCSGSMGFDNDDVWEIIKAMPAGQVALYGGWGSMGLLKVVVRKGRRVRAEQLSVRMYAEEVSQYTKAEFPREQEYIELGMNVIDGPALAWLGKQPGPRIWISDGDVTGVDDVSNPRLRKEVGRLMLRHGIRRVEDSDEAIGLARKIGISN